jgi:hypothetical protein
MLGGVGRDCRRNAVPPDGPADARLADVQQLDTDCRRPGGRSRRHLEILPRILLGRGVEMLRLIDLQLVVPRIEEDQLGDAVPAGLRHGVAGPIEREPRGSPGLAGTSAEILERARGALYCVKTLPP